MRYQGFALKKKPLFWQFIPWLSSYTAQAIYPNIYVSQKVFENLTLKNPNPWYFATLEHERKHLQRQKELGIIKFGIKYLLSPKFRFREELLAIKEEMKFLEKKKLVFPIEKTAKYLSSWLYLWMVSFQKAKEELEKAREET